MSRALPADRTREALAAIARWRRDPRGSVACPACGVEGLAVADRSARPHAEWYVLSCAVCGLAHTLHIPMASPSGGLD